MLKKTKPTLKSWHVHETNCMVNCSTVFDNSNSTVVGHLPKNNWKNATIQGWITPTTSAYPVDEDAE